MLWYFGDSKESAASVVRHCLGLGGHMHVATVFYTHVVISVTEEVATFNPVSSPSYQGA
jgi:hypothetical protein